MSDLVPPPADGGGVVGSVKIEPAMEAQLLDSKKRKRGRPPRAQQAKAVVASPVKKSKEEEEEEDVCFICFDGGSLVLCDRRGCPKAYHTTCIKRDEAFFQAKAKWNCGWHICSVCEKAAHHMCYTCTYSVCKVCIKDADYVCVRGDKGFCKICMRTILLIEQSGQEEDAPQVDFDDKTSWEYLFKVYWVYLKGKLSLTLAELTQAKNPWKMGGITPLEGLSPDVQNGANILTSFTSDTPSSDSINTKNPSIDSVNTKKRKTDEPSNVEEQLSDEGSLLVGCKEWATKELLEFVAHMKNGDTSALSPYDVQALMLEYIKQNNLRDPRRKSHIICDLRLKNLFGKPRVGHFEMLKLIEFHFLPNEDAQKNVATVSSQDGAGSNIDYMLVPDKDQKRRTRRKCEEQAPLTNLDEFAAIDVHNITLIYLRRNWMESLLEDVEFQRKVVGCFVRIKITGRDEKHDMYRLVQVVGTCKADRPYKFGNKTVDFMLEVLNLDKKEKIFIGAISNQELSEDECKRLRQSIRCGLVKRFTVGEIQEKSMALESLRLNDWMEAEILRLTHLRDRASEKGLRKQLRECVEKIQLLKTPEERERRLREVPAIHTDPKMNPSYESEEDAEKSNNSNQGDHTKLRSSTVTGRGKSSLMKKRVPGSTATGSGAWKSSSTCETKNMSITYFPDKEGSMKAMGSVNVVKDALGSSSLGRQPHEIRSNTSASFSATASESSASPVSMGKNPSVTYGETDKLWHYRDPNGKVQGPFSMVQLQKWSTTGYFPSDMRIWATREEASLLLTDALKGQFHMNNSETGGCQISRPNMHSPPQVTVVPGVLGRGNSVVNFDNQHGKSSGQNWSAPTNLCSRNSNSNLHVSSVTTGVEKSKQDDVSTQNLHSSTPKVSNGEREDKVAESKQHIASDFPPMDLPSPTPTTDEDEAVQDVADEHSVPSKILIHDSGPALSCASSPVVGEVQQPDVTEEWGGYSPTPVKTPVERWDPHINSSKSVEVMGDQVATPTSNIQITHSSPPHPASTVSWQANCELIEFSTLAEESVSDLLAEVDAMESQCGGGLASPTSQRKADMDFMHGSIEEFSPALDQGTRSDCFSSTGDLDFPGRSIPTDELGGGPHPTFFDFVKTSSLQSLVNPQVDGVMKSMVDTDIALRPSSQGAAVRWPQVEREAKSTDILMSMQDNIADLFPPKQFKAEVVRETKSNAAKVEKEKYGETDMVDLNIAQGAGSEGVDLVWDKTTNLGSAVHVPAKEPCTMGSTEGPSPLTMGLDWNGSKMDQRTCSGSTSNMVSSTNTNYGSDRMMQRPSSGADTKLVNPVDEPKGDSGQPTAPLTMGTEMVDLNIAQVSDNRWGTMQANLNVNITGLVSAQFNVSLTCGGSGSGAGLDSQRRYEGEGFRGVQDLPHHGADSGFNRARVVDSRQPFGGGNSRTASQKGQRICKFHENGRCRYGASCTYKHQ